MRRYQLSGLDHVHMMRRVPRSYDMTRTHILHKSVNKHVDVVLRCSPKNWKKKKVTVSVVRGEKKNDAARIRANAKKGYVAVRKPVNDRFEADRREAAAALQASVVKEPDYVTRSAGSDALIHDMKSQISTMAKKSADYIDEQLTVKPENSNGIPTNPTVEPVCEEKEPLISPETEDILKKGGYKLPSSKPESSPYATDYLMHASNEEFHDLMDSLEKSLDEACRKYAVQPEEPDEKIEIETDPVHEAESVKTDFGYEGYSDYSGGYNMPGGISLSVTKKQEIKAEDKVGYETEDKTEYKAEAEDKTEYKAEVEDNTEAEDETEVKTAYEAEEEEFKPALTFTEGGEHYLTEDELFDRELNRPGDTFVPPAYFFDEEEVASTEEPEDGSDSYSSLPEAFAVPQSMPEPQNIFYTEEDDQPIAQQGGYPREDYVQQQIFFTTPEDDASDILYNPPKDEGEFAEPTLYRDNSGTQEQTEDESDYEPHMVLPDEHNSDASHLQSNDEDDEEISMPMIFPDENEEDLPPPMIFPDDDEGYSPAPVSPDRNEYFDDGTGNNEVVNRSGQTLFSRTGDQIKKVIGVIRGSGESNINSKSNRSQIRNSDVEITYTDRNSKKM